MDFWLCFPVAGFRVDAASHMIEAKGGLKETEPDDPHGVLKDLHHFAQQREGDVVFVGEACGGQLKRFADEHSSCAGWFSPSELDHLPLRTPFVQRMAALAATRPVLLPIAAVDVMTADEKRGERRR